MSHEKRQKKRRPNEENAWFALAAAGLPFILATILGIMGLFKPPAMGASGTAVADSASIASIVFSAAQFFVLGAAAVLAAVYARWVTPLTAAQLGLRLTDGRRHIVGGIAGATAAYIGIMVAAGGWTTAVLNSVGIHSRPFPGSSGQGLGTVVDDLFSSFGAGLQEELILLAVPAALCALRGWRPTRILVLLILFRLGIHIYLGWGCLFVLLWIPAAYLLYRAAGTIWPLVLGHAIYDSLAYLGLRHDTHAETYGLILNTVAYVGALVIALSFWRATGRGIFGRRADDPESVQVGVVGVPVFAQD
jgi:hypothetical protein